jgi:hypothetical protein
VSSRRLSEVAWPMFNDRAHRLASRAGGGRLCAFPTQGERSSRKHTACACRWGNARTPATLREPCSAVCSPCVGAERHAADVHRRRGLAGAPRSRILRTYHRGFAGTPGPRDSAHRVPCPPFLPPPGVGSSQLRTSDDALPCLAGRRRSHSPPSSQDRSRLHPMAWARRERGPNSRCGIGRVHGWRVGADDLDSVAPAPRAHGSTSVLQPQRECDRPQRDDTPAPTMRVGALRDALGAAPTKAGARAPPQ